MQNVPCGTIPCLGNKILYGPPYPLCPWEGRVLPIKTPPRVESVGIPLPMLDIIN